MKKSWSFISKFLHAACVAFCGVSGCKTKLWQPGIWSNTLLLGSNVSPQANWISFKFMSSYYVLSVSDCVNLSKILLADSIGLSPSNKKSLQRDKFHAMQWSSPVP